MLMPKHKAGESAEAFFTQAPADSATARQWAGRIIEHSRQLPAGVRLLICSSPLVVPVADLSPEELAGLLAPERQLQAAGVVALMHRLAGEVAPGDYLLDELADELARMPATAASAEEQFSALAELAGRGFKLGGLPADAAQGRNALLKVSAESHIALEYLLGNLRKAAVLMRRFGVRSRTLNASALFHNALNGFASLDFASTPPVSAREVAERAQGLAAKGIHITVFRAGDFNKAAAELAVDEIDALARQSGDAYGVNGEIFLQFLSALMAQEEARLAGAPAMTLTELVQIFKFSASDRDLVSSHAKGKDDPLRWKESPLGRALAALRDNLDWVEVSAGVKAAGELEGALKNAAVRAAAEWLHEEASGLAITLHTGREGSRREMHVSELSLEELLFDVYCLAVLERRSLAHVLDVAREALGMLRSLENADTGANLGELVGARLAGQSYAGLLAANGLTLGHNALVEALAKLKALADKATLTIEPVQGRAIAVGRASLADFRKALVLMGRAGTGNSPERVLGLIRDKILPEIRKLPQAVIAPGEHALVRLVQLAAAGVPARYALRRPWKRLNLDPLVTMGSCLAPGIRNCLGCPVNSLYGLVNKTALASGFEEIITYEATGCFEVYSGIWPYTGKKGASLHGVFGGAPSEMLGGLAARKARLKYAHKVNGEQGAAYRAHLKRTLHLGWGGDGATFDIGFGNLSGLFSRLQKLSQDALDRELDQRALYVCYDNEGYQNTGNQYSAASSPGGNTTTNPQGQERPMGNDLRKKPIVEIMAGHGASLSARMNIHRQEHIVRVVNRALEDGINGSFLHFLQPCTTGWKFTADSLTYDLAHLSEEGGLFSPVTIEHGVPYLEIYPTPRNPGESFLKLQARFRHLLGASGADKKNLQRVMDYYSEEWLRNLQLCGFESEIPYADRLHYLEAEHRMPRVKV